MSEATFHVTQSGTRVADGSGPYEQALREAMHYGAMYAQDGPVEVTVTRRMGAKRADCSCGMPAEFGGCARGDCQMGGRG